MKRIKFKKYDFSYLLNPITVISAVLVFIYVLKLLGVIQADKLCFGIMLVIITASVVKKTDKKRLSIILVIISVVLCAVYYVLADKAAIYIAERLKENLSAMGVLNGILNTFGIFNIDNLIYYTSYGGIRLINEDIACGIINIVKLNSDSELSVYLSGKIISMFSLLGIVLAVKESRGKLLIIALISFLCGNPMPLLLALMLLNAPLYFMYLLFNFLSFLTAQLFSVKAAFYVNPSLFEIIYHSNNPVYIFAVSLLFAAVSYYSSRMVQEKGINTNVR